MLSMGQPETLLSKIASVPGARPSTSMPNAIWVAGPSEIWKRGSRLLSFEIMSRSRPSIGVALASAVKLTAKRSSCARPDEGTRSANVHMSERSKSLFIGHLIVTIKL